MIETGHLALERVRTLPTPGPVLDIGSGPGHHAAVMTGYGHKVHSLDLRPPATIVGSWPEAAPMVPTYGGIWCCHVLEHAHDVGAFLDACRRSLVPGGWLAVTVPPAKHEIVGGHVSLWNAGLLLYRLVLARFDVTRARVATYGYNISAIVTRGLEDPALPGDLAHDAGDIERLAHLFPLRVAQGFDGRLPDINWE